MSGQIIKRGPSVTLVPAGRSSGVFKDIKDAFKDKYLHVKRGKDYDEEELIRIAGNDNTTVQDNGPNLKWYITKLYLDEQLPNVRPSDFDNITNLEEETALNYYLKTVKPKSFGQSATSVDIGGVGITGEGWWFEILNVTNELIVSDGDIDGMVLDTNGNIQLFAFDKDNNRYYKVNDMVDSMVTDSAGRTVIKLLNNACPLLFFSLLN
jgi:hypothetical protein